MSEFIKLVCTRCGGNIDYIADSKIASCPFCGSAQLAQEAAATLSKLYDEDNADLRIYYDKMLLTKDRSVSDIQEAIRRDKAGYKDPQRILMQVDRIYVPAWHIKVSVDCAWVGKYSERRTVTKYRKVVKYSGSNHKQEVNEPYNDIEVIWHPQSGSHTFETKIWVPATSGFSLQQLQAVTMGLRDAGEISGLPPLSEDVGMAPASKTQVQAWNEYSCDKRIQGLAEKECANCIERLTSVSSSSTTKTYSLVYLPIAVVSYNANGESFRHFYNLKTGNFSGDLPLNEEIVQSECKAAAFKQALFSFVKWIAATILCIEIGIISALFYNRKLDVIKDNWDLWLILFVTVVSTCFLDYGPWNKFKWNRRAYLFRIFGNPPASLKAKMHAGIDSDKTRHLIAERAWNNALEGGAPEQVHKFVEHPAQVLLGSISPTLAILFSPFAFLAKVAITVILTAAFSFNTAEINKSQTNKISETSASLNHTPAEPAGDHTKILGTQPAAAELLTPEDKKEELAPNNSSSKAQEPVAISSLARRDPPSKGLSDKDITQQNDSRDKSGDHDFTAIKIKLAELKGELASVQSRIEGERKRWHDANATINALTSNRTTPVVRNSPEHAKMYEAQLAIKNIEEIAPQLMEKKASLEATIQALEKDLQ